MSTCTRCGAAFACAMADGGDAAAPCWCTALPAVVAVPGAPAACWCPACLQQHITALERGSRLGSDPVGSDPGVAATLHQ
jgi:hypothetical protein